MSIKLRFSLSYNY